MTPTQLYAVRVASICSFINGDAAFGKTVVLTMVAAVSIRNYEQLALELVEGTLVSRKCTAY